MWFMALIIDALNSVSSWFYSIYLEVYYWVWPFNRVAWCFYQLSLLFNTLAWSFYDFSSWVSEVTSKVANILSTFDIWSFFQWWFNAAEDAWYWVWNATYNIWRIVEDWWPAKEWVIKSWFQETWDWAFGLFREAMDWLAALQTSWDSFKEKIPSIDAIIAWWGKVTTNILVVVNDWWKGRLLEVQGLINSAFLTRESLWAGWQDLRVKVTEFFTDPEDWLYKSFDRIIERFW